MPLDKTNALVADLAAALKLPPIPPDDSGGFLLTVGEATDLFIYGGDDETILVVVPIAELPHDLDYGLGLYLLRTNMFNSDLTPFQVAADEQGGLILWGRLQIATLDGASLAGLIGALADRAVGIRAEAAGDEAPAPA